MAYFEHFPYTNFHDINLDRMIDLMEQFRAELKDFVNLNTVKYADPFDWDITSQYPANTIVMDPSTGVAYISVRPVPAGAPITDTSYWTPVFDLTALFEGIKDSIAAVVEQSTSATVSSPAGTLIWVGNTLYEAQVAITAGDTYRPGGNVEHVTIEELLNRLKAEQAAQAQALEDETEARIEADEAEKAAREAADADLLLRVQHMKFPHAHATKHLDIYVANAPGSFQYHDPWKDIDIYVLGQNISDDNEGLDPEHPVRTLKRAWDVMAENAAGAYIHFIYKGTYDMYYPVINGAQVHLQADVAEVTLTWGWSGQTWTLAFYDCYIHLNGLEDGVPMRFVMTTAEAREAYLEAGKIFAQDVIFTTSHNQRFGVVGGYGQFTRCTFDKTFVSSGNVVYSACTFAPSDANTKSTAVIQAYNGAHITFTNGTKYVKPSTHANTTSFLSASAAIVDTRNLAPNLRDLTYGVILSQSLVLGADRRVKSWLSDTVNDDDDNPTGQVANINASLINDVMYYPVQGTYGPLKLYNGEAPHVMAYNNQTLQNVGVLLFSPGYFNDNGTTLRMQIQLGYTIPDNAALTFTKLEIQVRDSIGAVLNPTDVIANPNAYTLQVFVKNNIVYVRVMTDADHAFKHGSTVVANNTICVVGVAYIAKVTY